MSKCRLLQHENNLAETAFVLKKKQNFTIRWFTPTVEVDLCGHATLAAAFVIYELTDYSHGEIQFYSPRSGALSVNKEGDYLFLNFPTDYLREVDHILMLGECIGISPQETLKGKTDFIAILEKESDIVNLKPDFQKIAKLDARGLIVTAPGDEVDFVSRFFAPQSGINEDPVTGSAHTTLIPFWSARLEKTKLRAKQLSKRGGELLCTAQGDRCLIGGQAKLYMIGDIFLE